MRSHPTEFRTTSCFFVKNEVSLPARLKALDGELGCSSPAWFRAFFHFHTFLHRERILKQVSLGGVSQCDGKAETYLRNEIIDY